MPFSKSPREPTTSATATRQALPPLVTSAQPTASRHALGVHEVAVLLVYANNVL